MGINKKNITVSMSFDAFEKLERECDFLKKQLSELKRSLRKSITVNYAVDDEEQNFPIIKINDEVELGYIIYLIQEEEEES